MTAEWEGEERPLPQLQPFLKSPDRAVRERAFRASTAPVHRQRATSSPALFDRMYALRQRAARNAGFANFRTTSSRPSSASTTPRPTASGSTRRSSGRWRPAVERVLEHRRQRLGLDVLRPWDLAVDPYRRDAAPAVRDDAAELVGTRARGSSTRVDPALGARVPDHDRRAAARPGEPEGQGARRLLRDAPLPRAGRSSS